MIDLPECKYRRFSRRGDVLQLHCFLRKDNCTHDECVICPSASVETGQRIIVENENGEKEVVYFSEVPDPNFAGMMLPLVSPDKLPNWIVEHRPDLQAISTSLPPARPGKDRRFTMELDGSIVYEQEEGEWEPPRNLKGYKRDLENPFRFTPLWPKCVKRFPRPYRSESCCCVQVNMKCLYRQSKWFDEDVTYQQCQQCSVRETDHG